jgi:hypothetical protein
VRGTCSLPCWQQRHVTGLLLLGTCAESATRGCARRTLERLRVEATERHVDLVRAMRDADRAGCGLLSVDAAKQVRLCVAACVCVCVCV